MDGHVSTSTVGGTMVAGNRIIELGVGQKTAKEDRKVANSATQIGVLGCPGQEVLVKVGISGLADPNIPHL